MSIHNMPYYPSYGLQLIEARPLGVQEAAIGIKQGARGAGKSGTEDWGRLPSKAGQEAAVRAKEERVRGIRLATCILRDLDPQ